MDIFKQKSDLDSLKGGFTAEIVELREDCIVVRQKIDRGELFVYVNDLDKSFKKGDFIIVEHIGVIKEVVPTKVVAINIKKVNE